MDEIDDIFCWIDLTDYYYTYLSNGNSGIKNFIIREGITDLIIINGTSTEFLERYISWLYVQFGPSVFMFIIMHSLFDRLPPTGYLPIPENIDNREDEIEATFNYALKRHSAKAILILIDDFNFNLQTALFLAIVNNDIQYTDTFLSKGSTFTPWHKMLYELHDINIDTINWTLDNGSKLSHQDIGYFITAENSAMIRHVIIMNDPPTCKEILTTAYSCS